MTDRLCSNKLGNYQCSRRAFHPGACIAESGHWWAKYDSGRDDKTPEAPLPDDLSPTPDMRKTWRGEDDD